MSSNEIKINPLSKIKTRRMYVIEFRILCKLTMSP